MTPNFGLKIRTWLPIYTIGSHVLNPQFFVVKAKVHCKLQRERERDTEL